jgi:chitinase
MPRQQSKQPLMILIVFAVVMGFLGYEMLQFRLAGKKVHGVEVQVRPEQATVKAGESQTFEAAVLGSEDPDVIWSVQEANGGMIVSAPGSKFAAGKYTAPGVAGTYHVVARSKADERRSAECVVTVTPR